MSIKLGREILKTVVPYAAVEWVLPVKMTVSEWSDQFRRLDVKTSAEPGQWSDCAHAVSQGDHGRVHGPLCR